MKVKAIARATALAAVWALVLAGCSTPSPDSPTQSGSQTSSAPAERTQVSLWTNLSVPAQSEIIEAQVQACAENDARLSDVDVVFEVVTFDNLYTRLSTAVAEGTGPGVIHGTSNVVSFLQAQGSIVPVGDVVDTIGEDEFLESFLHIVGREGETWGVPDWYLHQGVYYRTDAWEAAGLTEPPSSWQELLDYAKALTKDGVYGYAIPLSGAVSAVQHTIFQFWYADNIYVFDPETGEYAFDKDLERAAEDLEWMLRFYNEVSPPASMDWGLTEYRTAFVQGQTVMTPEWGATPYQAVAENPDIVDKIGAFEFPAREDGQKPGASLADGYYFVVGEGSDRQIEASKQLIECIYTPDSVAERALGRPIFAQPATTAAYETDLYQNSEIVQQFADEIEAMRNGPMTSWYRYGSEYELNPITGQIESTSIVPDNVQAAALGQITALEAVQNMDAEFKKLIEEFS